MAAKPPYPRQARIVPVKKGSTENSATSYELRADYPRQDTLISEHTTEQEAQDAKIRYEDPNKA